LFVNAVLPTTPGWKDPNCWALYDMTQKDAAIEVQEEATESSKKKERKKRDRGGGGG